MFQSTKVIKLGSCAFRQWRSGLDGARPHAGNNSKRCSYVHGYELKAKFWFECSSLDDKNWAVDFGGLKDLKSILQQQFDHTLCVAEDDPLMPTFLDLHHNGGCDLRIMDGVGIEKTAEWCFNAADRFIREHTNHRCWVSKVEVWEHSENSAIYQQ